MKLILHYMKRYKVLVALNILSVFGFALVELGIPTLVSNMIDEGVLRQDRSYLFQSGFTIAVISIVGVCGTILLGYCCAKISTAVTRDIRNDVFARVQSLSHAEMNQFGVSSLITRTNNDAYQIMMFLNVILRTALLTPVMIVVSFALTIRSSLQLSLIIASTIPIIVIGVVAVGKVSQPISERQQGSLDRLNRIFRENLTGIRVIRSFNNDAYETKRFDAENRFFMKQSRNIFKLMSSTEPVFFLVMNFASLAIYFVAAGMIDANTLQVGKLVAFMEYLFHAMLSVMLFCTVFMMYPRASVSAKRIREVLDTQSSVQEPSQAAELKTVEEVCFDHVTFAYPDGEEAVLSDVSFTVRKGETIAFIGSTGSGKSTLVSLVPRFYDVSSGSIRINGTDVRQLDLQQLRSVIGYVAQKAVLFRGTIAENIRFGKKDASEEEVRHAAEVAQACEFISAKPKQFEERIVEGASNVSGGQKQRLSIARAIVRHPQIYIYDDSFSALDFATDAKLRKALKGEVKDAIMMIVAQRVSTIMNADQIVVLNEGRVVGQGTHSELLKTCQIYHEIASSQLSEEELAYGK
ncbi:ABC transporter ATP-binding protein [Amedibacillus dolichus]|uniref:ABC transporter ATP-binding protein n=1 Tax=Amedibacillus dolichus TaxID=31971 RepID=A0ABT7UCY4_9FIRM|nr:ABC transporter ATP-binding protein [Amedibacillus dolichus]MDM8157449.1 ABC transporter ATP-binding protein [Amedibacillus dolichus]